MIDVGIVLDEANWYLWDDQITVVDGSSVKLDEHIGVTNVGDLAVAELEAVEPLIRARHGPLLGGLRCHEC